MCANRNGDILPASAPMVNGILARLGLDRYPSSHLSLEDLERLLKNTDWSVRLQAVRLLRWKGEAAISALEKAATDQHPLVRTAANYFLQGKTP